MLIGCFGFLISCGLPLLCFTIPTNNDHVPAFVGAKLPKFSFFHELIDGVCDASDNEA